MHAHEIRVINLDARFSEIGGIEEACAVDVSRGRTLVNGPMRRTIVRVVDHERGILAAIPARDGAVFGDKEEASRPAVGKDKVRAAVENRASWSGSRAKGGIRGRRNRDGSRAIDGDASARTGVERSEA